MPTMARGEDLPEYFSRFLPMLSGSSNIGAMLTRMANGYGRNQPDVSNVMNDDAISYVSLLRPIERRLAMLTPDHLDVLRATFATPEDLRGVGEWAWLTRETELPICLLALAAKRTKVKTETLLRWRDASTSAERIERTRGVTALKGAAERFRDDALAAWGKTSNKSLLPRAPVQTWRATG